MYWSKHVGALVEYIRLFMSRLMIAAQIAKLYVRLEASVFETE